MSCPSNGPSKQVMLFPLLMWDRTCERHADLPEQTIERLRCNKSKKLQQALSEHDNHVIIREQVRSDKTRPKRIASMAFFGHETLNVPLDPA